MRRIFFSYYISKAPTPVREQLAYEAHPKIEMARFGSLRELSNTTAYLQQSNSKSQFREKPPDSIPQDSRSSSAIFHPCMISYVTVNSTFSFAILSCRGRQFHGRAKRTH